ncbi:two-component system sensor histidine kinase NtrB [Brachyspira hyodysenteriae]|uniref:two-component system sensor histidine kinase NtrB n=1 Tax=Brachyspira hyodysenteriae TaxID=159 RepID=UPI00063D8C1D|nr:ATP-binding protein [Brachyspira hyodysenteriae]AUJ48519.1 two-component sensor histidine kinase [Brachyspira hyodysenteriae]KLI50019.1 histidine kinase [Brachyspira hyodysenteriae]KLI54535.1 histidine kinase [Brachyspira hyodysenteriae]MCZ9937729.1 ATP-binding protein [Brachyspira hyodysenteriae]MDA0053347.1 ATP-binding protein [Brachyspira hyodysenteriae]
MNRRNQFFDKILQNFDKVSDNEKKKVFKRLSTLWYSQNIIIENLEEGIIAIDEKNAIQGINKKACFLFSIPRNSEGKALSKYMSSTDIGRSILELIRDNISDTKLLKDDENERILQINILPIGDSGRIIGTLIKAFDITKTYESAQKLKRAEQLASLTTLAAGVAHEIKNPLGSISIYVQLIDKIIKKNMDNECQCYKDFKEYSDIIKEEISRLEETINSFLFSVRKLELNIEDVNINELILSTIAFLKYEIEKNNVNIDIKFDKDNLILKLDEKYIKQSLINIIQNAIDAMSDNADDKKKEIFIKLKTVDNYAVISIKDTGSGIKEDTIGKIFEPYFTTKRHGTGLGLTNVVRIIEAHNGNVTIESEYGKGSEFIIKLPLQQENQKFLETDL